MFSPPLCQKAMTALDTPPGPSLSPFSFVLDRIDPRVGGFSFSGGEKDRLLSRGWLLTASQTRAAGTRVRLRGKRRAYWALLPCPGAPALGAPQRHLGEGGSAFQGSYTASPEFLVGGWRESWLSVAHAGPSLLTWPLVPTKHQTQAADMPPAPEVFLAGFMLADSSPPRLRDWQRCVKMSLWTNAILALDKKVLIQCCPSKK